MSSIGYLVSELQAPSHTFVRREIAAVRAEGVPVRAYSIHGERDSDGYSVVLGHSPLSYLAALCVTLVRNPVGLAKAWALSLRHRPRGGRALIWSQFHLVEAVYLARLLAKDRCRHLHSHFANSGATVGLLAAKLAGISWSLTLHGISETDLPAGATLARKIEAARFVACASRFMMAQGMRIVDRSEWGKFTLVRCPIDLGSMPQVENKSASSILRVLCVGRLSAEKGYTGLFEALSGLPSDTPDYALTIIGDGPMSEELRASAEEKGLAAKVNFRGALPERETLAEIATCDFLVLPSLMEGLPVVLLEARALGKPVIATGIAGIPELVVHKETGLLFEPANWSQLGERIATMLTDAKLRQALAQRAARDFPEEFETATVARTLAHRFTAILTGDAYS